MAKLRGRDIGGAAGTAIGTAIGGPAGGAIGAFAGGFFGGLFDSETDYLTSTYDSAIERYKQLGIPPEEARPLILEEFRNLGVPDAVLEEKLIPLVSKLGEYKEEKGTLAAQKEALRQLSEVQRTGITPELKAASIEGQLKADRAAKAFLESKKQELASRGLLSSGAELALMSQAGAAGSAQAAEERLAANRLANQMALEAISGAGRLAGEMRGQGLSAAQTTLGAQDTMARFGREQEAELARRNIERMNLTLGARRQKEQQYGDLTTQQRNLEQQRRREAEQRDWARKEGYITGLSDLEIKRAGGQADWRDREAAQSGEIGRGLMQLAGQIPAGSLSSGFSSFFNKPSSGFSYAQGRPSNPMEEIEAERAASESLKRYGYPGSRG